MRVYKIDVKMCDGFFFTVRPSVGRCRWSPHDFAPRFWCAYLSGDEVAMELLGWTAKIPRTLHHHHVPLYTPPSPSTPGPPPILLHSTPAQQPPVPPPPSSLCSENRHTILHVAAAAVAVAAEIRFYYTISRSAELSASSRVRLPDSDRGAENVRVHAFGV